MRELARAVPDLVRLMASLVRDPVLPRAAKIVLAAAAVYLVSPLDLVPDVIPGLGVLDDVLVVAVVVDGLLNHVDRAVVLRYWPGSPETLERIARSARFLAAWVPRRVKRRVFGR